MRIMKSAIALLLGAISLQAFAEEIFILPLGYKESWTGRTIFNPDGASSYHSVNGQRLNQSWPKLYQASTSDTYTVSLPQASLKANNARVEFRTPISLKANSQYRINAILECDTSSASATLYAEDQNGGDSKMCTVALSANEEVSATFDVNFPSEVENLCITFGFVTRSADSHIKISNIEIIETSTGENIWDGSSYFNYLYYVDGRTSTRLPEMGISGRNETLSWTLPEYDDSEWDISPMPLGNAGYDPTPATIWPSGDYTNYWIRRDFNLDSIDSTAEYKLYCCHDDSYAIYVNGTLIDTNERWTDGPNPVKLVIPTNILRVGKNVIATYIQQNVGGHFYDCGLSATPGIYEPFDADAHISQLIINEVTVANIDRTIDYSNNYGGWIELYNPSDKRISLDFIYISDEAENLRKFQMPKYGVIKPGEYRCIYFDHNAEDGVFGPEANKQVNFKLATGGGTLYLSEDGVTPLLEITYPAAVTRCSYARIAPDSDRWNYNALPTPNEANSSYFASERLDAPVIDVDSKLFTEPFDVNIGIPAGTRLIYTTDGSAPSLDSGTELSDGKLHIDKTGIYRFCLVSDDKLPSVVVTRSYIYRDRDYYLPVVSVSTNPANLYDDYIGVYVDGCNGVDGRNHGPSNINMDWERPVNFEYLTPDGKMAINQEVTFECSGGWSRHFHPTSFKIKANKIYEGLNSLDYPFFSEKQYNKYKNILVRNGGNDNDGAWKGRVRDAITQKILITNGLYIDAQDYQPAHVFFNGEYIGMLNIREPNNKINGTANYGYDDDMMDAFEYSNGYFQKEGTRDAYDEMVSLSASADNDDVYDEMRSLIDMDAYVNFMAATTYIGSTDCILNNNNIKGYRELPDGKFHFTLHDQDFGWGFSDAVARYDGQYYNQFLALYNNLKTNASFCRQFVDSYCVIAGSIYTPERINQIADSICALVAPALSWENRDPVNSYNEQSYNMLSEHSRRARIDALRSAYDLGEGMAVTLSANIPQASMMVNTQPVPDAKFNGTLFAPVVLTAAGPSNFEFVGWAQGTESNIVTTNNQLKLTEDFDASYIAVFKPISAQNGMAPVRINEVSADNDIYVNELIKKDDWIELYNTTDEPFNVEGCFLTDNVSKPKKYEIMPVAGTNTVIPPHGTLLVWASKRSAQSQLHASFKLENADGCTLMLTAPDESWNDTFEYNAHTSKESYGRYPDGANEIYRFSHPTIDRRNQLTTYDFSLDELPFSSVDGPEVSVDFNRQIESVVYYDIAGHTVAATEPGIYIRVTHFTDGTAVSEKVLVK